MSPKPSAFTSSPVAARSELPAVAGRTRSREPAVAGFDLFMEEALDETKSRNARPARKPPEPPAVEPSSPAATAVAPTVAAVPQPGVPALSTVPLEPATGSPPDAECGMRNAECGMGSAGRALSDSALRTPHSALNLPAATEPQGETTGALPTDPAAAELPEEATDLSAQPAQSEGGSSDGETVPRSAFRVPRSDVSSLLTPHSSLAVASGEVADDSLSAMAPAAPVPPPPNGTSAAQLAGEMKTTRPATESAGLPKQILPGDGAANSSLTGHSSFRHDSAGRDATLLPQTPEARPQTLTLTLPASLAGHAAGLLAIEWLEQPATDGPTRIANFGSVIADRVLRLVESEVTALRRLDAQSLGVVLKPDERTELFLQLTRANGRLEATVRCEQGDFHALSAHWEQLRQSLARHEVHLAPLQPNAERGTRNAGSEAGNRESQYRNPEHETPDGNGGTANGEGAVRDPFRGPRSAHRVRKGWESWA